MKLKLVIDTNVFISAVLFKGQASKLASLWKINKLKILVSKEVLEEYLKVLSYPKFRLSHGEIEYIIKEELLPFIEPIRVKSDIKVVREDIDDNKFIALGIDGSANYIISGDIHLLSLKRFQHIEILSIKDFLKRFLKRA